jgi:hypothetical protein
MPMMIFISVDLPAPFSPISACTSPARTEKSTPERRDPEEGLADVFDFQDAPLLVTSPAPLRGRIGVDRVMRV